MVVVPAGTFKMGEGTDTKDVTFARAFAVGKFEVTFDDWDACVAGSGCKSNRSPSDQGWGKLKRPVINVSWHDAQEYVRWLSGKTGKAYRLLSEAEWEYAARATTTTAYFWGDAIGRANANCDGCGSQWDNKQTAPVGQFKANAWGLHDMHGNVWEWVQDCYASTYAGSSTDGSAAQETAGCSRVLRGGSWYGDPRHLRAPSRSWGQPENRNQYVGFRVGRSVSR
jgi:formylglycine-generating enzyme required for sulfatase activity